MRVTTHMRTQIIAHSIVFVALFTLCAHSVTAQAPAPANPRYENPFGTQINTIPDFLALVLTAFSALLLPLVVIFIIYAGFLFVTAQGEEGKIEKARHALTWSIIGAGVILGARIIANILRDTLSELNQP